MAPIRVLRSDGESWIKHLQSTWDWEKKPYTSSTHQKNKQLTQEKYSTMQKNCVDI